MNQKLVLVFTLIITFFAISELNKMPDGLRKVYVNSHQKYGHESWERLARSRVFFAHQSVGQNIVDGIADLMHEHPLISIQIFEGDKIDPAIGGVFTHVKVGENFKPLSKIEEFVNLLHSGIGESADMAALKFCYVDVSGPTSVDGLFARYKKAIEGLQERYPDLILIHFTMPLTTIDMTWLGKIKRFIGIRDDEYNNNILRNRYNQMLLDRYKGNEPILDIAEIESLKPDGSVNYIDHMGKASLFLADEYTYDGGHLNELGRKSVAEEFLLLLNDLG